MALIELITEEVVRVPLKSTTKHDVFRELLDLLHAAGRLNDPDSVFDELVSRDNIMSTALEKGIAIPHAKTTAVKTLVMALGISPKGINCDSLDGEPTKLFFLVLAPPDQSGPHIEALAEIARATRSNAFIRLLLSSQSSAEVVESFCEN